MARDDFSKPIIDTLGKRVGARCSNPSCRKLTTGPGTESHHIINIGVGAHITAAATGGPRYDPTLSSDQRRSPENGIWLCQSCAKLIDSDPVRYTVNVLLRWKSEAESSALAEIEGPGVGQLPETSAEIEIRHKAENRTPERHDYRLEVIVRNLGTEPLGKYHVDVEMPAPAVHNPQNQMLYVRERSNNKVALFRVISEEHRPRETIFPGDEKVVMSAHYFVDDHIYRDRSEIFQQPVKATLYHRGFRPVTVQREFNELEEF